MILDHIFGKLNISGGAVHHPIVLTEPLANNNTSRRSTPFATRRPRNRPSAHTHSGLAQARTPGSLALVTNELLFELYGVPGVSSGVDALFSYYYNAAAPGAIALPPGVVVCSGHTTTTMLAITPPGTRADATSLRRYSVPVPPAVDISPPPPPLTSFA